MQRIAQDWLVLTLLTNNSASAVGIVMALQFGPQAFLFPLTGFAADYFNRKKILIVTQCLMAVLALGLGLLTLTGLVQLWHVYVFALLLGALLPSMRQPDKRLFLTWFLKNMCLMPSL